MTVVARLETRPFRDQTGSLRTPNISSAVHYHVHFTCVCAGDPNFLASTLIIPEEFTNITYFSSLNLTSKGLLVLYSHYNYHIIVVTIKYLLLFNAYLLTFLFRL